MLLVGQGHLVFSKSGCCVQYALLKRFHRKSFEMWLAVVIIGQEAS